EHEIPCTCNGGRVLPAPSSVRFCARSEHSSVRINHIFHTAFHIPLFHLRLGHLQRGRRLFLLYPIRHFGNHCVHLSHVSISAFPWRTIGGREGHDRHQGRKDNRFGHGCLSSSAEMLPVSRRDQPKKSEAWMIDRRESR